AAAEAVRVGHYRWFICSLLFFATTINYVDRQDISGLAKAAHQGWSANLYTLTSDMFPSHAVASVVGIGGFGGAIGGMLIAAFTGFLLQWTGSDVPVFVLAGSAYLAALALIHVLVPKLEATQL